MVNYQNDREMRSPSFMTLDSYDFWCLFTSLSILIEILKLAFVSDDFLHFYVKIMLLQ